MSAVVIGGGGVKTSLELGGYAVDVIQSLELRLVPPQGSRLSATRAFNPCQQYCLKVTLAAAVMVKPRVWMRK